MHYSTLFVAFASLASFVASAPLDKRFNYITYPRDAEAFDDPTLAKRFYYKYPDDSALDKRFWYKYPDESGLEKRFRYKYPDESALEKRFYYTHYVRDAEDAETLKE